MNHRLMVTALAAVLCAGGIVPSIASDLPDRSYISLESLSLGSGFQKILAEEKPVDSIRQAVIRDLDIPEEAWRATKYSYNYTEGENGKREVLVLLRGPWTSGTGESTLAILTSDGKDRLHVSQTLTLIHSPLIVVKGENGKPSGLLVRRYGGGARPAWVLLTRKNGLYEGVNEGQEIENISGFRGTAFFANDFILNDMTGRYHTLEGKDIF
jgi:hypothetical protein